MIDAPLVITANVLLVASFIATKQSLKNSSNFLIVCISFSDALVGAILLPMLGIIHLRYDVQESCTPQVVARYLQLYFCGVSMNMTMLLAFDRYLHINPDFQRYPSRFSKLFQTPNIYVIVCSVHLLTGATVLGLYFLSVRVPEAMFYVNAYFSAVLFFSMGLLLLLYGRSYSRIRCFVARNPINRQGTDSSDRPEYLKQLFKTVLILLAAMLVAWTPIFVFTILLSVSYFGTYINPDAIFVMSKTAFLFFNLNAAINALIIFYRNKKSRKWLVKCIFGCCKARNGEEPRTNCVVFSNSRTGRPRATRLPENENNR